MALRPPSTEARRPGEAAHQRSGVGAAPKHGGVVERAECSPRHSCAVAWVGPKGTPSTQRLRREQTLVKVASLLAPPLFPLPVPSVDLCDLCLLPSLLDRSGASMAGSGRFPKSVYNTKREALGASMTGSVLPRLWPPSWVKSRLCPAAEL